MNYQVDDEFAKMNISKNDYRAYTKDDVVDEDFGRGRDEDEKPNLMEQTQILCFPQKPTVKSMIEKQKLTPEKIASLNRQLKDLCNNPKVHYIDVQKFNKISGLFVNFRFANNFFVIEFTIEQGIPCFITRVRMMKKDYDSDDEDTGKFQSYEFIPVERLVPAKLADGTNELTVEMYIDFVCKCLNTRIEDFERIYRR
jgi:hypothetical protein